MHLLVKHIQYDKHSWFSGHNCRFRKAIDRLLVLLMGCTKFCSHSQRDGPPRARDCSKKLCPLWQLLIIIIIIIPLLLLLLLPLLLLFLPLALQPTVDFGTCRIISFHFFLSATNSLHHHTPSTWRSLSSSSFHSFLGLPLLVPSSSWAKIFLDILSPSILSRWPNQLILYPFIHFTIFSPLPISSSPRIVLFHSPFSYLGPYILLNISLWKISRPCFSFFVNVHASAPYHTTGLISVLYNIIDNYWFQDRIHHHPKTERLCTDRTYETWYHDKRLQVSTRNICPSTSEAKVKGGYLWVGKFECSWKQHVWRNYRRSWMSSSDSV